MNNKRVHQISEEVRKALSEIIQNKIKDPRIPDIISVTGVEVTNDLSFAKVYISVLGTDEEKESALEGLESAKGFMKKELGRMVKLRAMPELILLLDDSVDRYLELNRLLDEVNNGTNQ